MADPNLKIPVPIAVRPARAVQKNVPQTRFHRDQIKEYARAYVAENKLVPPLPFDELKFHAETLIAQHQLDPIYRDFAAIILSNESWRDILAAIPYEKRLLLMPVCLRIEHKCPAPFDEFGLLCKSCGLCSIHDLKEEAERLGYPILIAEGTPIVLQLIQTGKIEAVVGISCLNVLERVFPYMEAAACPGIAIPLLQDDCKDTNVDLSWIWDAIHLTADDKTYRMDLDGLRAEVDSWFEDTTLLRLMGHDPKNATERLAREWLGKAGKRWRPFLTVAAALAHQANPAGEVSDDLKRLAISVECFHKASLIHDDIEDGDSKRYGEDTMHEKYGVPVALNAGDLLIGEGYRLIAECEADGKLKGQLMQVAARGHRTLCLGQGAELNWTRDPRPMTSRDVLTIFREKTAPAFEVALKMGALYGHADEQTFAAIEAYSEALGIAYQIRDDLEDIFGEQDSNDARDVRPSVLLALAHQRADGDDLALLESVWRRQADYEQVDERLRDVVVRLNVRERTDSLLDAYKEEAVRALRPVTNPTLKGLLRRIIGKIFDDGPIVSFCRESS